MGSPRIPGRGPAVAILFLLATLGTAGAASAEPTVLDVSDQPIIMIQHPRPVVIHTWDRPQIAVDSDGDQPVVDRRTMNRLPGAAGNAYSVPISAENIPTPNLDQASVALGPEEFVVNPPSGPQDVVRIRLPQNATPQNPTQVMIPAGTAVLSVNGAGNTIVEDYHGQLIAQQRAGPMVLRNDGGSAFVQNLRGQILVVNSTFDRLRTRTAVNNMIFSNCTVKQIEASSVHGSIVFNNGTFEPGLARFETQSGNVAIGVNGNANLNVKGAPGQIFQRFDRPTQYVENNGEASATLGGGGPLVNVLAQRGRVYLYDGSLTRKGTLPPHWSAVRAPIAQLEGEKAMKHVIESLPRPPRPPRR